MLILAALASFANVCLLIGGMVFAISRRKRHPRVSRLVLAGLGLSLCARTVGIFAPMFLSATVAPTPADFGAYMQTLSVVSSALTFVSWFLLLRAIFIDRDTHQRVEEEFLAADGREHSETGNPYQAPG